MAIRLSTALRNQLLDTGSFKGIFSASTGFVIDIYTGSQPTTADDAPTGTKLVTISNNSAGTTLHFDTAAASGSIGKLTSETWSGTGLTTGTAGWFRIRMLTDAGGVSTTVPRYDGACATSGAQLNLGSLTITTSAPVTISAATFTVPSTV